MGFLRGVLHYASVAWGIVSGVITDPAAALQSVWKFIGSVQSLLSNLFGVIGKRFDIGHLGLAQIMLGALQDYLAMIRRIAHWIWGNQVNPVRLNLIHRIAALRAWTLAWIRKLIGMIITYYWAALRYTNVQVGLERKYRLADIRLVRAWTVRLIKAALATVDREASTGYNSRNDQRKSAIAQILTDIGERNPAVKGIVSDLVTVIIDAAEIDDPLIRVILNAGLRQLIDRLGVDKLEGNLVQSLLNEVAGNGPPRTLEDTTADIAGRLGALENQQADFMKHGGPEVEQAGDQWKALGSVGFDVALLGFFALAVADPAGWAAGVNDTAGAIINTTANAVSELIKDA